MGLGDLKKTETRTLKSREIVGDPFFLKSLGKHKEYEKHIRFSSNTMPELIKSKLNQKLNKDGTINIDAISKEEIEEIKREKDRIMRSAENRLADISKNIKNHENNALKNQNNNINKSNIDRTIDQSSNININKPITQDNHARLRDISEVEPNNAPGKNNISDSINKATAKEISSAEKSNSTINTKNQNNENPIQNPTIIHDKQSKVIPKNSSETPNAIQAHTVHTYHPAFKPERDPILIQVIEEIKKINRKIMILEAGMSNSKLSNDIENINKKIAENETIDSSIKKNLLDAHSKINEIAKRLDIDSNRLNDLDKKVDVNSNVNSNQDVKTNINPIINEIKVINNKIEYIVSRIESNEKNNNTNSIIEEIQKINKKVLELDSGLKNANLGRNESDNTNKLMEELSILNKRIYTIENTYNIGDITNKMLLLNSKVKEIEGVGNNGEILNKLRLLDEKINHLETQEEFASSIKTLKHLKDRIDFIEESVNKNQMDMSKFEREIADITKSFKNNNRIIERTADSNIFDTAIEKAQTQLTPESIIDFNINKILTSPSIPSTVKISNNTDNNPKSETIETIIDTNVIEDQKSHEKMDKLEEIIRIKRKQISEMQEKIKEREDKFKQKKEEIKAKFELLKKKDDFIEKEMEKIKKENEIIEKAFEQEKESIKKAIPEIDPLEKKVLKIKSNIENTFSLLQNAPPNDHAAIEDGFLSIQGAYSSLLKLEVNNPIISESIKSYKQDILNRLIAIKNRLN